MKESKINRRDFVRGAAAAGAGLALGGLLHARHSSANRSARDPTAIDEAIRDQKEGLISEVDAQATVEAYMVRSFGGSRVVHVHDPTATDWSGQTDYWNHVDQAAVDDMVDQGIETLTGRSSLGDAWQSLLPDYQSGKSIAIKLNFNNSSHCDDSDGQIDALIQPVNAVVRGLLLAGVAKYSTLPKCAAHKRLLSALIRMPTCRSLYRPAFQHRQRSGSRMSSSTHHT